MKSSEEAQDKPGSHFDAGATVKAARLKKGLRQEEVARALRMPVRHIQALEHNKREEFPAAVYYRGALQAYCEQVDLDFPTLWKQMQPPTEETEKPAATAKPAPAPSKSMTLPKVAPSLIIPAALFGTLLFAAAIVWLMGRPSSAPPPAHKAPAADHPAAPPPPVRTKRHMMRIEPSSSAWVRIRVDRKLVFEGNLPAGRATTWEGDRSFGIRSPRESVLRVSVDDQPLDLAAYPHDTFGNILIQPGVQPSTAAVAAPPAEGAAPAEAAASTAPVSTAPPLIP